LKILKAEQIRAADAYTIEHEPIASIDLMERAGKLCYEWIKNQFSLERPIRIFCGVGNNGGDGLVIGRLLKKSGYDVEMYVVQYSEDYSADFHSNLLRYKELNFGIHFIKTESDFPELAPDALVVDAIFGSGLNRPVDGIAAHCIDRINELPCIGLAIDIPSGLFAEENAENTGSVFIADVTLCFEVPKLSFLLPNGGSFVGEFEIIDIGLDKEFLEKQESPFILIREELADSIPVSRQKFSHKGSFGHALICAGSLGKVGASILASKACLRSGVGLLTVNSPLIGMQSLHTSVPEAMVLPSESEFHLKSLPKLNAFNVIGIGPGIGLHEETASLLKLLIQEFDGPMVLDADALNILSENKTWISFLPKNSILTPHPGEFRRLVGEWSSDNERLDKQIEFSKTHGVYLILKGAHTSIACPDGRIFFNSSGNPGMSTAGSGDVLTGMLTALLAQGFSSLEASILGVYHHGKAGDMAAEVRGQLAMTAGDIIDHLDFR
jgi:NAD(P)H-hydrate epimerase